VIQGTDHRIGEVHARYDFRRRSTKSLQRNLIYVYPLFTSGGSREAEMATPTSELMLVEVTARATPIPDGKATKAPMINLP